MVALDAEVKHRALDAARILGQMARVRAAYLFGSRAESRAHPWSDIDVALFLDGLETWDMRRRAQAMFRVQKEAGLDVEAHLFPAAALERAEEGSFAMYIMSHGIRLDIDSAVA